MKEALIKGLKSDEWYTPLETVKTMLEIFPPPKGARVSRHSTQRKAILQK